MWWNNQTFFVSPIVWVVVDSKKSSDIRSYNHNLSFLFNSLYSHFYLIRETWKKSHRIVKKIIWNNFHNFLFPSLFLLYTIFFPFVHYIIFSWRKIVSKTENLSLDRFAVSRCLMELNENRKIVARQLSSLERLKLVVVTTFWSIVMTTASFAEFDNARSRLLFGMNEYAHDGNDRGARKR